jgi:hypothetical protein
VTSLKKRFSDRSILDFPQSFLPTSMLKSPAGMMAFCIERKFSMWIWRILTLIGEVLAF